MSHRHGVDCNGYECMEREDLTFDQHMCEHVRDCTLLGWECAILASGPGEQDDNTCTLEVHFMDGTVETFHGVTFGMQSEPVTVKFDTVRFEIGMDLYSLLNVRYWISK